MNISITYTDIKTFLKNKLLKTDYTLKNGCFYKKYKWFAFTKYNKIGDIYYRIYDPGDIYNINSSDKNFLDLIKTYCDEYNKLTNKKYLFVYTLEIFKKIY